MHDKRLGQMYELKGLSQVYEMHGFKGLISQVVHPRLLWKHFLCITKALPSVHIHALWENFYEMHGSQVSIHISYGSIL